MAHETKEDAPLRLPLLVVSPSDVARLDRELEALGEYLHQAGLKKDAEVKLPRLSRMLDEFAGSNELDLLQTTARTQARNFLEQVQATAPVITMSFAVDPSSAFVAKIIAWLRQNIHPLLLLRIGLQPTIAAGCTVRTTNHYYDFSLRSHFKEQRNVLLQKLRTSGAGR